MTDMRATERLLEVTRKVTLYLCGHCLAGAGGECHSPGCSLFLNRAPDLPVTPIEDLGKALR